MGFFSSDEIVANSNSTTENTAIASALVVIVAVLIIAALARMYAKYIASHMRETARREVELTNIRHV